MFSQPTLLVMTIKSNSISSKTYLAVDSLVAVGGLHGQDDGRGRVLLHHERLGKRSKDGRVVVHVLKKKKKKKRFNGQISS